MRAGRVLILAALGTVLCCGPAAAATEPDGPGDNSLRLQTDRLENQTQADVTGSELSAMLFDPADSAGFEAAREAREAAARSTAGSLFVVGAVPAHPPGSAGDLFPGTSGATGSSGATGTSGAVDATRSTDVTADAATGPASWWAPAGLGALLLLGAGLSLTVREPGGATDA
jgi:hypothetical protein